MSLDDVSEGTSLLSRRTKVTPLPWAQLFIVLFAQFAEPLTFHVINPFAPQLIRDTGITGGDETKVGFYVGVMQASFFLAEALTVLYWGRLSDQIGRKPVILFGLFGVSASMWSFGLSKTFWFLVLSRWANGAMSGNIGVLKSMMAELTDSTNIAQAFAYFLVPWCSGLALGPIIGGTLSRPAEQFPGIFGNIQFLKDYPYFLACAVPAMSQAACWLLVFFFLKETVKNVTPITHRSLFQQSKTDSQQDRSDVENSAEHDNGRPLPLRYVLTYRVVIAAGNYALLALCEMAFRTIQPVFLSTPVALGGLGLSPSVIGRILAIFGILIGVVQVFFFAKVQKRWGSKRTYLAGISTLLLAFAMFPLMTTLVKKDAPAWLVWAIVLLQTVIPIGMIMSYGTIFIYITAASPNKASIGATNGISQMTVSLFRAIGPAISNGLYSVSLAKGYMGGFLVYYVLMAITLFALWLGSLLPDDL